MFNMGVVLYCVCMSNRFSSCLKGKLGPERLSVDGHVATFDFFILRV